MNKPLGCQHCRNEAEPGWIETDNNGPIVACPICNRDERRELVARTEDEAAEMMDNGRNTGGQSYR